MTQNSTCPSGDALERWEGASTRSCERGEGDVKALRRWSMAESKGVTTIAGLWFASSGACACGSERAGVFISCLRKAGAGSGCLRWLPVQWLLVPRIALRVFTACRSFVDCC
jgi:hypothetical protein